MKLRESEIFNNYIKLATDAGLISEEEIKKKANAEKTTRYDSYSFSDMEALYGHKFTPNEKEGETIADVAHPETVVVGPAYDAMNAVIENLHQRQEVMQYIANKVPDGHLVQRRYVKAADDLKNSLIRTGFSMDASDEEDIMKLADDCANRLSKEAFEKTAVWGFAFQLALMATPYIVDWAAGGYAKHVAKSSNAKDKNRVAARLKPQVKARAGKAMGRLGAGIALVTVYNVIKNHFVGSIDKGIEPNANELLGSLSDLAAKSDFDSAINSYMSEVRAVVDANRDFANHAQAIGEVQDINEIAGVTKEHSKPINDFFNAIDKFNKSSADFLNLLEKMPIQSDETITDTEAESLIRQLYTGITGSDIKTEVSNDVNTLVHSLKQYRDALSLQIRQSISQSRQAVAQATKKAEEEAGEKYIDYVSQEFEKTEPDVEESNTQES